ncbi:MAG: polyamine aminopropyltransferase [Geminicoccales bacterium]
MHQAQVKAGAPHAYLPLLLGTFVIAVCGLVYELIAGTISSYLLGDSVFQFSIVIGLFMTAMGLGAFLSRYIESRLERAFVATQIALGLVGGLAAPILFFAFAFVDNYEAFLVLICLTIGALVGLEIPLVTRILQQEKTLQINISNILTADYIGALVAALLFPLVLVPQLGLISTSLVFGLLNLAVAGLACRIFWPMLDWKLPLIAIAATLLLLTSLLSSHRLVGVFEGELYQDEIIYAETTPYQRIVVTQGRGHVRFFLNGGLQFDSVDEHRYHESLVHPAMGLTTRKNAVLILGGGDGMAVREILKHEGVKKIKLVDLDPAVTQLFRENPRLTALNDDALNDPRVEVVHQDAFEFLKSDGELYNVILIDLPDPKNPGLSKLYSLAFYTEAARHLARDGVITTQATSPVYARKAFWSIAETLGAAPDPYRQDRTLSTQPYHAYIPSFGDWGFVMAGSRRLDWADIRLPDGLDFLETATLPGLIEFPSDIGRLDVEVNTLQAHPLLKYYEEGWAKWFP